MSGRLSHPNIVPVVDFDEHEGGSLWLVPIFVRGGDLGAKVVAGFGAPHEAAGAAAAGETHHFRPDGAKAHSPAADRVQIEDTGT